MAATKKRAIKSSAKVAPQQDSEKPPAGILDDFFGWLNQRYNISLPRLSDCPQQSVARSLLCKKIAYQKTSKDILYRASLEGEISVFENILLSGFVVQIQQKLNIQPKNHQPPIIELNRYRTKTKLKPKESRYG